MGNKMRILKTIGFIALELSAVYFVGTLAGKGAAVVIDDIWKDSEIEDFDNDGGFLD